MRNVVLISPLLVLVPSLALATSEVVRDPKSWDFAPLLYSDRIVRGTVVSVTRIDVSVSDIYQDPPELRAQLGDMKVPILRVAIKVGEVLRGPSLPQGYEHEFLVLDLDAMYPVGLDMLVCERYHSLLKCYYQGGSYGRYIRKSHTWLSEVTARGQRRFEDTEMRAKIASMDLDRVAADAELIFEGDVDSVAWSELQGPDGSSADLVTLQFSVGSIEKGAFTGDEIEVKALGEGLYLPEWRKHIPRSFQKGQRWICFLRKNEIGWYPFAGTNGWFQVSGDSLIYDERIRFWHSPEAVRDAARRAGR